MESIEEIIVNNKNLIYSIANYFDTYNNKEDLFQAGCLGIINAYKNFNDSYNIKFTTYAYPYIVGEMKKLIREDKNIKISRDISRLSKKIEEIYNIYSQKLFRMPTNKEIAELLGVNEYIISEAINANNPVKSIDESILSDSKEITLHEIIPDKQNDITTLIALKDELEKLSALEKEVVKERYFNDYTQKKVADNLGMSQVQVSRQEQKVLEKLRKKLV